MIGLNYLTDKIDAYNLNTLPHSIILVGKEGSGKHLISDYIGTKLNLPLLDISEELSDELIGNIYRDPNPRLYRVDLRKITEKDQNILLKLFEEPAPNAFIVLLANHTFNILPTVLNRGILVSISKYSVDALKEYAAEKKVDIDPYYLGTAIETPGDIQKVYSYNVSLDDIKTLVDKILNKLTAASFANTLTIVDKLNFKDEYDKIDVDFFLKTLLVESADKYKGGDKNALHIFSIVNKTLSKMIDTRLNKKILISNMLCEMWMRVRE